MDTLKQTAYVIYYLFKIYLIAIRSLVDELLYKFGLKKTFKCQDDLTGRTAIVTGGTRGLGLTVVRELISKGCSVYVTSSQTNDKFSQILEKIHSGIPEVDAQTNIKRGNVKLHYIDLSQMDLVKKFATKITEEVPKLNYLICNAGIMFAPRSITGDGFESHFAVNYLGHCLLALELLPIMRKTSIESGLPSRIINVSSSTHRVTKFDFDDLQKNKYYSSAQAYGQSKLAQIMFTAKLSRYLDSIGSSKDLQVFCLHPGVVLSDLYEHVSLIKLLPQSIHVIKLFTRDIIQGAETTLYATLSRNLDCVSGKYLEDCDFKRPSSYALDKKSQEKLWKLTHELLSKWLSPDWDDQSRKFLSS